MASGYIKSIHCIIYRYNLQSSSVLWAGSGVVAQAWNPKAISVLNWSPCLDIFLMDVPGRSPQSQSPGTEGHTKVAKFCCLDSQITGVCLRFQCILAVCMMWGLGMYVRAVNFLSSLARTFTFRFATEPGMCKYQPVLSVDWAPDWYTSTALAGSTCRAVITQQGYAA